MLLVHRPKDDQGLINALVYRSAAESDDAILSGRLAKYGPLQAEATELVGEHEAQLAEIAAANAEFTQASACCITRLHAALPDCMRMNADRGRQR